MGSGSKRIKRFGKVSGVFTEQFDLGGEPAQLCPGPVMSGMGGTTEHARQHEHETRRRCDDKRPQCDLLPSTSDEELHEAFHLLRLASV